MATLSVEYISPDDLKPYGRTRASTRENASDRSPTASAPGFTNPILIDSQNMILAGRVEAATLLTMANVPRVRIETTTPAAADDIASAPQTLNYENLLKERGTKGDKNGSLQ